jgi:serine-type D-Ala-D-Ala carboxypeptidase (penicillin-binding protein 5/6)
MRRLGYLLAAALSVAALPAAFAQPSHSPQAVRLAFTPEEDEVPGTAQPLPEDPATPGSPAAPAIPKAPPQVKASAAILVDSHTGQVLYDHNSHARRPMASTTKIITATLILERGNLDDVVTVSKKAANTQYGSLHLRPGEKLTLRDILYGIMLRSANDGCVAAAEHIAGSEAAFVQMMNEKARELGALDTHFVTTNGLFAPEHYSTAADLAKIACYATRNPAFNALTSTTERKIERSIAKQDSVLRNRNKFLKHYPGADGIKTGYVRQSGFCLVASATHPEQGNPWRLISVVLNSPDTIGESSALLDYGFSFYKPIFAARKGEVLENPSVRWGDPRQIAAVAADDAYLVFPRSANPQVVRKLAIDPLNAPLKASQTVGKLTTVFDGQTTLEIPLLAAAEARKDWKAVAGHTVSIGLGLLLFGLVPIYARAITKGSRKRRRRVPARRRAVDPDGSDLRQRVGGLGAWD